MSKQSCKPSDEQLVLSARNGDTDALAQLIRKSVREELKCGDVRQTAATAEPEELPDQVLDFISMLQEE